MTKIRFSSYINGMGMLSPQPTFNNAEFLPSINEYHNNVLQAVHPDFKEYINPVQLRRLSRMLRIGLATANICHRDSGGLKPDGVITASGYGFLIETAKFMSEILQQDEKQLTPTFFMQSTYNALSGLIALTHKCMGYNNAFVSHGHAFETAYHDAIMSMGDNDNFLVGGFDEASPVDYKVLARVDVFKKEHTHNLKLYESKTPGSLQGESAAFFMLCKKATEKTWCQIVDLKSVYSPNSVDELDKTLESFLHESSVNFNDVDVVVHGQSGDPIKDKFLLEILQRRFNQTPQARFKHLSGEYSTATCFGIWLGASIIRHQRVPEIVRGNSIHANKLKTVLVLNHYLNRSFSFTLLHDNPS